MNYIRPQYYILKKRLREKRKFIQVIIGPRQIGKTTLITQFVQIEKYLFHYTTADSVETTNKLWITQQWEAARIKLKSSKAKQLILIIDEIQKIDNWSEIVKKEWDKDSLNKTNIKLVILGSSTLMVKKGLTESLAGRFEILYLGHWSLTEINNAFCIKAEKFAWYGGYPGSYQLIKNEQRWKEYVKDSIIETTVSKDILMLNRVNKPALLKHLFEIGCLYSGQILSYTKILGQMQDIGNTVTLSHYLKLLDEAGLITGLQKYSIQPFRQKASSPKFQVYNSALISAQLSETYSEIRKQPEKWGRIVETAVGAHLVNAAKTENFKLFYWRHVNNEVDFVLKYNDIIIGIEMKSGASGTKKGIEVFNKMFNPNKLLLVGSEGIPWQEFLKINPVELF
ncbi:archaeal ATPase [hydrothermal vent metagenome]|uniref:Archaeal ATPase n=1 Tax=hydrothermal vent metagenome TaxID=652676 RepID=A0A3B1BFN3_9ZZZZ